MRGLMQPVLLLPHGCRQSCHRSPIEGLLAGILGDVPQHSLLGDELRRGLPVIEPSLRFSAMKKPWIHVLEMDGFRPDEINVKVKDHVLCVEAKHEEAVGENVDIIERKRTVKIPEGVNSKKITCFLDRRGMFVIKAPFSIEKHCDGTKKYEIKIGLKKSQAGQNRDDAKYQTEGKTLENTTQEEREHCDKESDLENNSTEKCLGEEDIEHTYREEQQLDTDCIIGPKNTDKDTEDCQQINRGDDCLEADTKDSAIGCQDKCDGPGSSVEKTEDNIDNGDDVCTDIVSKRADVLDPLMDAIDIVEKDGQKYFHVEINLENFAPNNIKVLCEDKTLCVDAKREWEDCGVQGFQEFHRRFKLPSNALENEAKAFISDDGYFTVHVPMKEEYATENADGEKEVN